MNHFGYLSDQDASFITTAISQDLLHLDGVVIINRIHRVFITSGIGIFEKLLNRGNHFPAEQAGIKSASKALYYDCFIR